MYIIGLPDTPTVDDPGDEEQSERGGGEAIEMAPQTWRNYPLQESRNVLIIGSFGRSETGWKHRIKYIIICNKSL